MKKTNDNLKQFLQKTSQQVNPIIDKILCQKIDKHFHDPVKYLISTGGKRLRPALVVLCYRLFNGKKNDIFYPAAELEILHNYTLVVDDVIDHSDFRRFKPTVWKKYGLGVSECVSMIYAASIFDMPIYSAHYKEKIYELLTRVLKEISNGQLFDILFEQAGRLDESYVIKNRFKKVELKDYYKMVSQKTASLLSACCEMGAICAHAKTKDLKKIKDFGFNLGMAFQIQDDILDIFGDEKKFGKKIGKDIMEHKLGNIIILLTMQDFNSKQKQEFLGTLRQNKISDTQITKLIGLIKQTDAQKKAKQLEKKFIVKAGKKLKLLPQNKWNNLLRELLFALVGRES